VDCNYLMKGGEQMEYEIKIDEERLEELAALHCETGVDYSTLINSAIKEYFHNFMVELKRLELKDVKGVK